MHEIFYRFIRNPDGPSLLPVHKKLSNMKKLFTLALVALMALPMMAGKTEKEWNFSLNEDGECVVRIELPTSKSNVEAMKAAKAAINKQSYEDRATITNEPEMAVYEFTKNTKRRYNPFAGMFNESMRFKATVSAENGIVVLVLTDWLLINKYEGYGSRTTSETFSERISTYYEAENGIKDGSLKGKDKKEAAEKMEEVSDSLNECQLTLDEITDAIRKAVK